MKPALITVFCAAAAAGAWLSLPHLSTAPAFAAEVASAVQRANTWHFVGWRIEGGKKLPWEIWGRRQPFFYREQVGDDILIDNGVTRLRLLPPDDFQKRGYAVLLPSDRLTERKYDPTQRFVEGINGDYLSMTGAMGKPSGGEKKVIYTGTLEENSAKSEARLEVNTASHLPVRYSIMRSEQPFLPTKRQADSYGSPFPAADLTMKYDVAISREVMTLAIPPSYERVDGQKGLVLRPQFMGRDAQGTLHIKVGYQFGGKQIKDGEIYPWFHGMTLLQCPPYTQTWEAHYPTDELGQSYKPTSVSHGDEVDIYLKPTGNVALTPRVVKIPVIAKLYFDKGIPDPYVEVVWTTLPILATETTLTVPLQPATPQASSANK